MARKNNLSVDAIEYIACEADMTSHAGVIPCLEYMQRLDVFTLIDKRMPTTRAPNGYNASDMMKTLIINQLIGGTEASLSRIDDIGDNRAVLRMAQMKCMPSSHAVGDWLRRLAGVENGMVPGDEDAPGLVALRELFYEMTEMIVGRIYLDHFLTLDYDASVIEEKKKYSRMMYTGERGTMGYFAFVDRLCIYAELEPGNHSPSDHVALRTISCCALCRGAHAPVKKLRADSASYAGELLDYCEKRKIKYCIRAPRDAAIQALIRGIRDWRPTSIRTSGPTKERQVEVASVVHCMNRSEKAFRLIVYRFEKQIIEVEDDLVPEVPRITHQTLVLATNNYTSSEEELIEWYNERGGQENRNKELKHDLHLEWLPCGGEHGLGPNRAYAYIMVMLYNFLESYKQECMNKADRTMRLPTLRRRVINQPGYITRHARKMTVRLASYAYESAAYLRKITRYIRRVVRPFKYPTQAPIITPLIYRRI